MNSSETSLTVNGRCHCGDIRFRVTMDTHPLIHECNCSICQLSGFQHLIVSADQLHIESDEGMSEYRFNTGVARHYFCSRCGIKPYYVPRSNPEGFSVNYRCLDVPDGVKATFKPFDGQNWEDNAGNLSHLA